MIIESSQLKKFIIDSGLVSKPELDAADEEATKKGVRLEEVLVSKAKLVKMI